MVGDRNTAFLGAQRTSKPRFRVRSLFYQIAW